MNEILRLCLTATFPILQQASKFRIRSVSHPSACSLQLVSCWKDNWRANTNSWRTLKSSVRACQTNIKYCKKKALDHSTCTHHLCYLWGEAHSWQKKINVKPSPFSSHPKCTCAVIIPASHTWMCLPTTVTIANKSREGNHCLLLTK